MASRHRIRISNQQRFKSSGVSAQQMVEIAERLRGSVFNRIRLGINVYDGPAPQLSKRYAKFKQSRYGGKPIRDWWRTGRTMRSMKVLTAGVGRAVIGFTDAISNFRAAINNARHRQFGVSPNDRRALIQAVRDVLFSRRSKAA